MRLSQPYFRAGRLDLLLDPEGRFEIGVEIASVDSLKFKDDKRYPERLEEAEKATGETEALIVMQGAIKNVPLIVAAFEFEFMGGSMGSAVGSASCAGCTRASINNCRSSASRRPAVRACRRAFFAHADGQDHSGLDTTHDTQAPVHHGSDRPDHGGVSASFAMIGDVVIAEPRALIGFAGPRVIEQTVREKLPEGFQRAEFLLEKGAIDMIVDRRQMRDKLANLLTLLQRQTPPAN